MNPRTCLALRLLLLASVYLAGAASGLWWPVIALSVVLIGSNALGVDCAQGYAIDAQMPIDRYFAARRAGEAAGTAAPAGEPSSSRRQQRAG